MRLCSLGIACVLCGCMCVCVRVRVRASCMQARMRSAPSEIILLPPPTQLSTDCASTRLCRLPGKHITIKTIPLDLFQILHDVCKIGAIADAWVPATYHEISKLVECRRDVGVVGGQCAHTCLRLLELVYDRAVLLHS